MIKPKKSIRVLILGAGGHAQVIADALLTPELKLQGFNLVGFLDDNPNMLNEHFLDVPVLGLLDDLVKIPHDAIVIGIGDNKNRCNLFERLSSRGEKFATIIHPSAVIAPSARFGVGSVIFGGVVVNSSAIIKDNVILNTGCTVDHNCIIESHSHICPGAHIGGNVHVGRGSWIGIGSIVLQNRSIGEWVMVGGGAAVIKDVQSNTMVGGVPAKPLKSAVSKQRTDYDFGLDFKSGKHAIELGGASSPETVAPVGTKLSKKGSSRVQVEQQHAAPVVNTLFTSAGRRVELLKAFRNAYEALGLSGQIVTVDADPLAPCLSVSDRSYVVPSLSSSEYVPFLEDICRKEQIKLVFPLIDPDIPILANNYERFKQTGAEVVVMSKESVEITRDKMLTHKFFNQINIPNPAAWLPEELDPETARYPLFIKPRHGSAGKDSFVVENANQLRFFSTYIHFPIIEEFLPGSEITNDVVCDLKGKVLAVVSRKRIEVRSGEVSKGVTIYDEQITKACIRIAEGLGGKGQITVQCIMKNDIAYFTEINARFGGGAPLGIAAGGDAPRWLLAEAAGLPVDAPPIGSHKVGLYLTRFDDSFILNNHDLEKAVGDSL